MRVSIENRAITSPWNGSMKQTRKMRSPTCVTRTLVEEGETIGTPSAWALGAIWREILEATSPTMATAPSRVTSEVTALTASSGLP